MWGAGAVAVIISVLLLVPWKQFLHPNLPAFENVSKKAGLRVQASTFGNPTIGDLNGDGYPDFFFGNHGVPPRLYVNNGNGTFQEILESTGISSKTTDRHGSGWGDFDNDGDQDLYISTGANRGMSLGMKEDELYRNEGNGRFTNITQQAGVENTAGRSRAVNWVDYDNDGYLDIFVKNHLSPNVLYRNNGNGTFTDTATAVGLANVPGEFSSWSDFNNDRYMDVLVGPEIQLWKNDHGKFIKVANNLGANMTRSASWGDFDNDGDLDLFISGNTGSGYSMLLKTKNTLSFSASSFPEVGLDFTTDTDQIEFDVYVENCVRPQVIFVGEHRLEKIHFPITIRAEEAKGNALSEITSKESRNFIWRDAIGWHFRLARKTFPTSPVMGMIKTRGSFTSVYGINLRIDDRAVSSRLFSNKGDGTFEEVTGKMYPGKTGIIQIGAWGDFDNDGFLDLYEADAGNISHNAPGVLLHNKKGRSMIDVIHKVGIAPASDGRADGAAWTDYNNDGSQDLLLTNGSYVGSISANGQCRIQGSYLLYKNLGAAGRWLKVNLIGKKSNRMGIGAHVVLKAGNLSVLREMNDAGGGPFYSQAAGPLHFGIGKEQSIDTLTVYWPSGITQILSNVKTNQVLTIVEKVSTLKQ